MAPFSVTFVATCEWLLVALAGFYSLMFVVFGFYGLIHAAIGRFVGSFGVAILMGAIATGCFRTGSALWRGRRWAWNVSWGIGVLTAIAGWMALHRALWPSPPYSADKYFGLICGPVLLLAALVGFVMLILPQTRRFIQCSEA